MHPTSTGPNRTGAATSAIDAERLKSILEADSLGSVAPANARTRGVLRQGMAMMKGVNPQLLLDKIGERIAFERIGTRLYDAQIAKCLALQEVAGESPVDTLRRIRHEEHGHFLMLGEAMAQLGGDPTAETPCADAIAMASAGLLQVVTEPRTTMAQCLNAVLSAELIDNASWELLVELAGKAGQHELVRQFNQALAAEQDHLVTVRGWLRTLLIDQSGTEAV